MNNFASKLSIGSAQFGLNYGITNKSGKVNHSDVSNILELAKKNNVNHIDTAISYGDSESILGKVGVKDFRISTKLPPLLGIDSNFYNLIKEMMLESISRLKINTLDYVLLHRPEDLIGSRGKNIKNALLKLKSDGLVKKIGISIYSPSILNDIACIKDLDIVQSPLNVFDQRIIKSGWLSKLKDLNIIFHARSIFLQGLLLSNKNNIPSYFYQWKDEFEDWEDFTNKNNISKLYAAIKFVNEITEVDKLIIGFEDQKQFMQSIEAFNNTEKYRINYDGLSSDDDKLINPLNWK